MRFCVHPIICVRFCKGSEVDYSSCSVLSFRPVVGCYLCNRVHLHIVFGLLYPVCHFVNVLSCVDVIQSFMYVLHVVILDITKRRGERERERK